MKTSQSICGVVLVGLLAGLAACQVSDENMAGVGGAGCDEEAPLAGDLASTDHLDSDRRGIGMAASSLVAGATNVNPRRSLAVTDAAIVSTFSLSAVLNQLAAQSAVSGMTGVKLFQQLWDTQNTTAAKLTTGPHCDDAQNKLNGFPYACRPAEGAEAINPSVNVTNYSLVGLYNRFDLAPITGSDCGEYRMVFAKTKGLQSPQRAFIIFEAVLANPQPSLGLQGCRPVAKFWADLSSNNTVSSRATALHDFYFNGLSGFSPVISIDNYGNIGLPRATGQVRVNMFLQQPWVLREFKLQKLNASTVQFTPATDKTNPFGNLFNPTSVNPQAATFQGSMFPSQVAALAVNDINMFNYAVPNTFNTGESVSQVPTTAVDNYVGQFSLGGGTFASNIQTKLTAIGSTLTPANIVARAEALSCAGCHQLSAAANGGPNLGGGLLWPSPASGGFVHSSDATEIGPDGTRFVISPALTNVFLPRRKQVLESFLNATNSIDRSDFFVRQLFLDVLSREPDPGGFAFWLSGLDSCTTQTCLDAARVADARAFMESQEHRGTQPQLDPALPTYKSAFVDNCYVSFLRRSRTAADGTVWLDFLTSTGDFNAVVRGFITSAEYRSRFGTP